MGLERMGVCMVDESSQTAVATTQPAAHETRACCITCKPNPFVPTMLPAATSPAPLLGPRLRVHPLDVLTYRRRTKAAGRSTTVLLFTESGRSYDIKRCCVLEYGDFLSSGLPWASTSDDSHRGSRLSVSLAAAATVPTMSTMLVSVAELSNIFSVLAVLICFCAMVLFILRYVHRTLSAASPRLRCLLNAENFALFRILPLNFFL